MKILVVGGGGREHAIIKKLKESERVSEIFALPGNGGIADDASCHPINAKDIEGIVEFALEKDIDFAVVAPDDPLVLGAVDALEQEGVKCFGPCAKAAQIEGSKIFAKELMKKYSIPTADFTVFDDMDEAISYLESASMPIVIKADGLALGKGVIIAQNTDEAKQAVYAMMREKVFGKSGERILIEECLTGPEVSVLAFSDGKSIIPLVSCMDHKRALDDDKGKNTGGMGAIAPNPYYTEEIAKTCMQRIFMPTIRAMSELGRAFKGCIYFGLMLTDEGPQVIEYNCRFGDPEAQAVLPLLKSDLLELMEATADERLHELDASFYRGYSCCVILASKGYPEDYDVGCPIKLPNEGEGEFIYVSGARKENGTLVSGGGRVISAVALGETLDEAIQNAYSLCKRIEFENGYYRKDIGKRALQAQRERE